jgi:hypothetical protein
MKSQTRKEGTLKVGGLYGMDVVKRSMVVWASFQGLLWLTFAVAYLMNRGAWINVAEVPPVTAAEGGWLSTLLYIIFNNLIVCALIVVGNLFVRFGKITPGVLVLALQAVMIGWLAGSNGFEIPFPSVASANLQYLRIGLWETTSYALLCAVTLPKSLLIADAFPATKWESKRKIKDLHFDGAEKITALLGVVILVVAAIIETRAIFR